MPVSTDVNTALIQGLLGNAPSEGEVDQLQQDKAGALSRMQSAYSAPQTPEDYSPFQDMVASYLSKMTPGWNQAGLGPAVAAPYMRALQNAQLSHEENIKGTTAELANAQADLRDATAMRRAAIMAGASLGRVTAGGQGKWVVNQLKDGTIVKTNNLTGAQEVTPSSQAGVWKSAFDKAYDSGLKNQDPSAYDKAVEVANAAAGAAPAGVTPVTTKQSQLVPINRSVTAPAGAPAATVADAATPAVAATAPLAPGSATPAFNLDVESLPDTVQAEVERLVNRAEAQPNNVALQRNTAKRLQEISTQYPVAKPAAAPADQNLPPVGAPATDQSAAPQAGAGVTPPAAAPGGAPSVTFMTPRTKASEEAAGRVQGEQGAKDLSNYSQTYYANSVIKNQTGLMRQLAAVPGIPSGELAPQIQLFRNTLGSIGVPIDSKAVSAPQLFESLATNFALHQRTQSGQNMLPGSMSNYEDAMLRSMVPMLKNTPAGRQSLIDFMETAATANQNVSSAAMNYAHAHNNTLDPEWYSTALKPVLDREMARMKMRYTQIANQFSLKGQQ